MKKHLILSCTILLSFAAYAKETLTLQRKQDNSKIEIGISIGKSLTFPVGTYDNRFRERAGFTTKRLGFAAAFHFQYNLNEHWALRTELLYQRKRGYFRYSYYFPASSEQYMIEDNIKIAIPVLLRYNANRFFAELGFYVGDNYGVATHHSKSMRSKLYRSDIYSGKYSGINIFQGACIGVGYQVINKKRFSLSLSLRNDQEIKFKKKFLWDHPYNTTMLLLGFSYKL